MRIKPLRILSVFPLFAVIGLALTLGDPVAAQTYTNLHNFMGTDGAAPYGKLIVAGNVMYGTTKDGGSAGAGTVFKVNIDGSGFTNLYNFSGGNDGSHPHAGLVLSGNTLYGTAPYGGVANAGTIFKVNTNGSGFTNLHVFSLASGPSNTNSDGVGPFGGLVLSGNTLYGTASSGGIQGCGTVFSLRTNGTAFVNLYNFSCAAGDGAYPIGLILSSDTLYGVTLVGGTASTGSLFKLNTNGTLYTNFFSFTSEGDGANPNADLVLSDGTLYGTAQFGGARNFGAVFKVNADGSGFMNLHSFMGDSGAAYPFSGVVVSGNTLYGTTYFGGSTTNGTIFKIDTSGSGFTNLYSFTGVGGAKPHAGLVLSGNTFYGTASAGGNSNNGMVFSLSLPVPPHLSISRSDSNVILTWATNVTGFRLYSAASVSQTTWVAPVQEAVVVNGRNSVTNSAVGAEKFYRLMQ
jgi:uncharacterized repeat protein (TIGR03803 family)